MRLDELTVTVRERSLGELYDLALLLGRRHLRDLLLLICICCLPFVVMDWLLLHGEDESSWLSLGWLVALLVAQAPLATAPITAYLGEAMFSHRPTVRMALILTWRRLPALLLLSVLRGVLVAVPVALLSGFADGLPGLGLLVLLIFFPIHGLEVVLLERQSIVISLRRAHQLMTTWRSEAVSHLLVGGLVVVMGSMAVTVATAQFVNLIVWDSLPMSEWWRWFHPGGNLLPALVPWPFIVYLAMVRFLSYIDLRTRREGWEVEIDLRRSGRRIEAEGAG